VNARAADALATRRELLLARSARLRDELVDDLGAVRRQLGPVERGFALARSGLLLPLVVGLGAALVAGRPARGLRRAGRVLALWPLVRPLVLSLAPRALALVAARVAGRRRPGSDPSG
jgi:hypothetical protein